MNKSSKEKKVDNTTGTKIILYIPICMYTYILCILHRV